MREAGGRQLESKVVGLESGSIVMIGCSQTAFATTHRLFAVTGEATQLVTLPDYDASGWFASDQASMAEIDAGTGVLTTLRKSADNGSCGSEGRYQWDGDAFRAAGTALAGLLQPRRRRPSRSCGRCSRTRSRTLMACGLRRRRAGRDLSRAGALRRVWVECRIAGHRGGPRAFVSPRSCFDGRALCALLSMSAPGSD